MSVPIAQAAGQWSGWFDFFSIGDAPLIDCEHFISCFVDSRWPDDVVDVGPEDATLYRFLKSEEMRKAVLDACRDGQLTPRDGGGLKIRELPAHSDFEPLRLFFKPDQFMAFAVDEWDIRAKPADETSVPQGTYLTLDAACEELGQRSGGPVSVTDLLRHAAHAPITLHWDTSTRFLKGVRHHDAEHADENDLNGGEIVEDVPPRNYEIRFDGLETSDFLLALANGEASEWSSNAPTLVSSADDSFFWELLEGDPNVPEWKRGVDDYLPSAQIPGLSELRVASDLLGAFESRIKRSQQSQVSKHPVAELPTHLAAVTAPADVRPTKRERQIRAIEAAADTLEFQRERVPTGGKQKIKEYCKENHAGLFGAGDDPFKEAWQQAVSQGRIRMADHDKFVGSGK